MVSAGSEGAAGSLPYRLANQALWAVNKTLHWLDGTASRRYGWDPYMRGSFAPVESEVHSQELEVLEGALPEGLEGAYVRTGPNPKLEPSAGIHWFDGDGMIHAVRFSNGKATYCNRWVDTARLQQEQKAGWPVAVKMGDYRGLSSLVYMLMGRLAKALGLLSDKNGLGTANTAIACHAGRLLALHEGDLPYSLALACNGLVSTLGRATFEGKIGHAFTAHPKLDPETGELFYFGYSVEKAPHCWYGWLDPAGRVVRNMPVPLKQPVMMHDCALTANHMLLLDVPLVFDPKVMVREGKLPFEFQDRPVRIGVLPRYATSADEIKWFSTENFMAFHVANAWEEGSTIRLFLCCMKDFSLDSFTASEDSEPFLSEVTIDLESGATTHRRLPGAAPGDFPVVPDHLTGRPTRFAYVATMNPNDRGVPQFSGITKYDLQLAGAGGGGGAGSAVAGQVLHGGSRLGGEAVFVPKPKPSSSVRGSNGKKASQEEQEEEDAGYLMTFVTDEATLQSELVVYDAASMASAPVARLRLPQRVPHGFHGAWVSADHLAAQAARQREEGALA